MKYVKWAILPAFMLITIASALSQVPDPYVRDYNFQFRIKGLEKDTVVYLANYYGDRQYYFDTTEVVNGRFTFKGDEIIGGIYSVIMQNRRTYFEFVVNEPSIAMETDTVDFVNRMTVKTSEENRSFYAYLQFINAKQEEAAPLRDIINTLPEDDAKRKKAEDKLRAVDSEVKAYKENYMTKHPDFFSTKVFQTTDDPVVPRPPATAEDTTVWKYRYFKNHYFDLVDFEDERLLRTPVFHNKLNYYLNKLTVQHPDSIIISADLMAKMARATPEMFKYVVHTVTNKYERSKVVCMDAVFVHMAKTYYCNGDAFWMTDKQTEKVCTRANAMAPLRCGQVAQNIILPDTSGTNWVNLHKIDSKFTVLLFWSPTCGHCKKAMPDFVEFYNNYHDKGVELVAVCTEFENKEWAKYLEQEDLPPWVNISDNPEINKNAKDYLHKTTLGSLNFRDTWDIFSTPQVYLLDEHKRIIAKKLMPDQLSTIIDSMLEEEAEKARAGETGSN